MHTLFCQTIIQEVFFPALSFVTIIHFSEWAMPIIYIEGIKPPCKPLSCCTLGFIRGKGDTALNNTRLWLSLWIHQLSNSNPNYLHFRIC
jgi:hypothetical protein